MVNGIEHEFRSLRAMYPKQLDKCQKPRWRSSCQFEVRLQGGNEPIVDNDGLLLRERSPVLQQLELLFIRKWQNLKSTLSIAT